VASPILLLPAFLAFYFEHASPSAAKTLIDPGFYSGAFSEFSLAQPRTALLARTFAAKSNRSISLDFDEVLPSRRFHSATPSIKKRTPADELPGFPISYLDQTLRAGSRGEREH
jgi:hypothetical protein